MRLITLLNHCQHFPGFVYEKARLCPESSTIEIHVRPRRGSKPVCSGCHKPAAGYDQLSIRRFEFVPFWGFMVLLLYRMRRVDCRACGVRVEELPWAIGKHQLTKAYMLFLAHWARKLSWQETAVAFRSTWDKVCQAVEYVVEWGLEHRNLGPIQAIGVDEIQYAKGHKYLTLVYQIEKDCTRLLWIGKDRTIESFEQFFTLIGVPLSEGIKFVCSDMWQPYLRVIRERCTNAVNILDRFHIVAKMNEALDDVRAAEARRLVQDGYEPILKKFLSLEFGLARRVCLPGLLDRLATAADLQQLFPPAEADLGALAYCVEVFGMVLFHVPEDRSNLLRATGELALCVGEFALRLCFKCGDLVGDRVRIKVRQDSGFVHHRRPLYLGTKRRSAVP